MKLMFKFILMLVLVWMMVQVSILIAKAQEYPEAKTTHNEDRVAWREARNKLHGDGCEETYDFIVDKTTQKRLSRGVINVNSAEREITCIKWRTTTLTVVWIAPPGWEYFTLYLQDEEGNVKTFKVTKNKWVKDLEVGIYKVSVSATHNGVETELLGPLEVDARG